MITIGVDIGGTKVKAGVINDEGNIITQFEEQTNKQDLMKQVLILIEGLLQHHSKVDRIGIATAGMVNVENGSIHYATSNLPNWTGTKVKEIVENRFQLPTVIDNDANCAAFAEFKIGAAVQSRHFVCITLGTGVGAGVILNGQIYHGKHGGAGEIGHMIYVPNGRPCNCGKNGCWEQYVSGSALSLDIKAHDTWLGENPKPEELFRLANENHPTAIQIVNSFSKNLAVGIVTLQSILDVDCFVFGGGVLYSSQYWWNTFLHTLKTITNHPPVVKKAKLQNNAGMVGAGLMAMEVGMTSHTI